MHHGHLRCVYSTVWMHHMNGDETYWEKVWGELLRDVTRCIEQIQEATSHEQQFLPPVSKTKYEE